MDFARAYRKHFAIYAVDTDLGRNFPEIPHLGSGNSVARNVI